MWYWGGIDSESNHVHDMRLGKINPRDLLPQYIELEKINRSVEWNF